MNRTLRRPMFRIGGSVAEGITSGLDQPQLNASRVNFKRGRVVEPGGYQGDEDLKKDYQRAWKLLQDVRPKRDPYFPQFLAGMGLDLVSRPTSGNLMADIATSAKGPFDQWMQSKTGLADVDDKLAAALFSDVMDIKAKRDLQEAKIKGEKEVAHIDAAGGKKQMMMKGGKAKKMMMKGGKAKKMMMGGGKAKKMMAGGGKSKKYMARGGKAR